MPKTPVARADRNLVHSWYVRPIDFGWRGSCGGASPNLPNVASADVSGGLLVVPTATVLPLKAKSRLHERMELDVVMLARAAVEVVEME